ncbi:hypothetical protein AMJ49_02140 [Parcubacteria bacterium DG_74_2]|nr:MAG: hypothetical protein AMJ49_02140 [Parcubacteria bacterium DG_74_2]
MIIPKAGRILIPKIGDKIERKLKELNLRPETSPRKFLKIYKTGKHRYFSPCLTKEKEKFAFYARLHNNLDAKRKFIREINFLRKLKKINLKIKRITPEIINYRIEEDFEWFFREYPEGPPLGYRRNLTQKPFPGMVRKIIRAIFDVSKIHPKIFPGLKRFSFQNYLALGVYEDFAKKKIVPKNLSEKILRFIKENLSLLEKENKYFCHGDLNLGNILSDGKEIWIIDWELIHLNNFVYDIGYLWAHLWEAKRYFRQKLIKAYINRLSSHKFQKFKKILPIVVSYLSLGGIEQKKEREKIKILKKRRRFYLNLLKNCLNFEKLIKT